MDKRMAGYSLSRRHTDRARFVYVAGMPFSGTTLISHALAEAGGFFHAGEIELIWQRGVIENRYCGCGQLFGECEVWSSILHSAYKCLATATVQEMVKVEHQYIRLRRSPALAALAVGALPTAHPLVRYRDRLAKLYRAIAAHADHRVVVDSSKRPWYGHVLGQIGDLDVRVIHVVRDPRANVYSPIRAGNPSLRAIAGFAARWNSWHATTEALYARRKGSYIRLRYEDFVTDPRACLQRAFQELDLGDADLSFISGSRMRLTRKHLFSGNVHRSFVGDVKVSLDREWESGMNRATLAFVTMLSLPLMARYGYTDRSDKVDSER